MTCIDQVATLATFGSVWAVLAVGHNLADHVIGQTDRQAEGKAAPSAAEIADGSVRSQVFTARVARGPCPSSNTKSSSNSTGIRSGINGSPQSPQDCQPSAEKK
ncbi:hypothetical protein [Streptomyces sp. NBC_00076]|uniref:hypothetical protein n=1 Tax=Streptomyces sp. NBC_00076 TaxID=2975642 RepID=UPI003247EB7D